MSDEIKHDDGRAWGFIDSEGVWRMLPKTPMLLANLGPPPFDVTLPHIGEDRHIIHNPAEASLDAHTKSSA